jgi:glycogen operon protein
MWRDDVSWFDVDGVSAPAWGTLALAFQLRGASQGDEDLYVMINGGADERSFTIRAEASGGRWLRVVDTARESPDDVVEPGAEAAHEGTVYEVAARSIVVLAGTRG